MIVVRAETLGVCRGVSRALEMVERTLAETPGVPIFTLGPLIHNPRGVEEFRARGVVPVKDVAEVERGIVVIRSHGIGPEETRRVMESGLTCVDATCPHVRRAQRTVREHSAKGYAAIIVGDAGHGEVQGIRGYADVSFVIDSTAQARSLEIPPKAIVVCQTTFDRTRYNEICAILQKRSPDILVFDTGCSATEKRRESVASLAGRVDAIVVIGGKQSANTRWLYQAALSAGKPAWHVEGAHDIPAEISRYERVGISAGASTPESIIDEVEKALLAM